MIGWISKAFKAYGKYCLLGALGLSLIIGVFVLHLLAAHNFHVVSLGRVYRSGQMNRDGLAEVIHERGIKSILNLRGPDGAEWYSSETNISSQLGVQHLDFELSAARELNNTEMEQLLGVIERAPKPILIHCKSGADRTGLAGALYLYSFEGKSAERANGELNVLRGHLPYLFWRDTIAMDRSFWHYVSTHAPKSTATADKFSNPLAAQSIVLSDKVAANN